MGKLVLEIPSISRKNDSIEFIEEFLENNSNINGDGSLSKYKDCYEDWLIKLADDYSFLKNNNRVPAKTYFLVRESDNKIVGIINLRLKLNEYLKNTFGNIGYSIRPSERKKGYGKIILYLGLIECKRENIDEVLLSCDKNNIASSKIILSLGGKLISDKSSINNDLDFYTINVTESLDKYKSVYENR